MPGMIVTAEMDRDGALKLAKRVAKELEFEVESLGKRSFRARQGNLAASIIVGAFIAYCDFEIEIEPGRREGNVDIVINRNSPWWTGIIGVGRVKGRARQLAEEIGETIHRKGYRVRREKEF